MSNWIEIEPIMLSDTQGNISYNVYPFVGKGGSKVTIQLYSGLLSQLSSQDFFVLNSKTDTTAIFKGTLIDGKCTIGWPLESNTTYWLLFKGENYTYYSSFTTQPYYGNELVLIGAIKEE